MSLIDWGVLAAYAALILAIGWFYSRENATPEEYLLGGRRMSPIALGLSLFATLVSALSYLAGPGEMVAHGPMLVTNLLAQPIIFLIVGYLLIPHLMKQPVTSAYELLETRLGRSVRKAGAGVFLLLRLGWMATILFAASREVLVPLLGVDHRWIPAFCVGLGLLTASYSSTGGFKAVVMTDALQAVSMLSGAIVSLVVITIATGGVSGWWPSSWPDHWQTPSWGFDPSQRLSFGILLISTTLWYVCTNGSDQMSIQRFLSSRDPAGARKTLLVAQISDTVVALLLALTGVALVGYFTRFPDRLGPAMSLAKTGDQVFPRFIMYELPTGCPGIVIAAILSAALSSLSSGINSSCAVIDRDFLNSNGDAAALDSASAVRRLRKLTWMVMLAAVVLSLLNLLITGNLLERCYKLTNLLTAPLFVLFFLALFVPWSNAAGAWSGLLCSIVTAISIAYSPDLNLNLPISFVWMMPCSLLVGIGVGSVVSWITPGSRTAPRSG